MTKRKSTYITIILLSIILLLSIISLLFVKTNNNIHGTTENFDLSIDSNFTGDSIEKDESNLHSYVDVETETNITDNKSKEFSSGIIIDDGVVNEVWLLIGDSYGCIAEYEKSWGQYFQDIMATNNSKVDIKINCKGGAGLIIDKTSDVYYGNLINELYNSLTDDEKSRVTKVICMGGYNDGWAASISNLGSVSDIITKSGLENQADFYFGMIGTQLHYDFFGNIISFKSVIKSYMDSVDDYNLNHSTYFAKAYFLNGMEYVLRNRAYISTDGIHPTIEGEKALACALLQCITNGSVDIYYSGSSTIISPNLKEEIPISVTMHNDITEIIIGNATYLSHTNGFNFNLQEEITTDALTGLGDIIGYIKEPDNLPCTFDGMGVSISVTGYVTSKFDKLPNYTTTPFTLTLISDQDNFSSKDIDVIFKPLAFNTSFKYIGVMSPIIHITVPTIR